MKLQLGTMRKLIEIGYILFSIAAGVCFSLLFLVKGLYVYWALSFTIAIVCLAYFKNFTFICIERRFGTIAHYLTESGEYGNLHFDEFKKKVNSGELRASSLIVEKRLSQKFESSDWIILYGGKELGFALFEKGLYPCDPLAFLKTEWLWVASIQQALKLTKQDKIVAID